MFDKLRDQIKDTLSNIECDTVGREDRILTTHVLEEFMHIMDVVESSDGNRLWIGECTKDMVGSTSQLVEDGLIQD